AFRFNPFLSLCWPLLLLSTCCFLPGVSLVSLQSREKSRGCAGCNGKIRDRFMLQALDRYWHEDCLKCACCDCRLGRVGSTLYTRANLILCRRDYLRAVRSTRDPSKKAQSDNIGYERKCGNGDINFHKGPFEKPAETQEGRLFGVTGNCAACSKLIPAFEMVMRARDNVYHLDCFACQLCRQRFCVGDKFFLKNNMILCQLDYEGGHLNGSTERQPQ
ncbi:hypothetical protein L3Q82_023729, partial [Scortum barcoo]